MPKLARIISNAFVFTQFTNWKYQRHGGILWSMEYTVCYKVQHDHVRRVTRGAWYILGSVMLQHCSIMLGGVEVKLGHHLLLLGGHCSTWAHENTGLWTCPRTGKKDDESFNYSIYLSYYFLSSTNHAHQSIVLNPDES